MMSSILELCLVTQPDYHHLDRYLNFLEQAILGGVTLVQLRDKVQALAQIRSAAHAIKALLTSLNIPLIINDHVALAKEVDAEGVHLGQSDLPPHVARDILGPDKIIGWSVESHEQLQLANQLTCIQYIGASAVFSSKTKSDCQTHWGLSGLKYLVQQSHHPVVAIGGISTENAHLVMAQGPCGVAVVSAIHDNPDPFQAAQALRQSIQQGKYDV